jgi:hypothetical protein
MSDMEWVKSRRCSLCAINYPTYVRQCKVKDCGEPTWPVTKSMADDDWQDRVKMLDAQNESSEPTEASPYPHPPDARARIYKAKDKLWVTHAELLHAGYRNLTEDSIVFLNENFYELQGYAEGAGAWWIAEVVTEGAAESLEPWMFDAEKS